mmetsp:Transcript_18864/g.65780  ORF Transcript_18864/g.65780 Transcript_18864/m.65780 type:complete len:209 (+) Transcript_18864:2736-3362(+)
MMPPGSEITKICSLETVQSPEVCTSHSAARPTAKTSEATERPAVCRTSILTRGDSVDPADPAATAMPEAPALCGGATSKGAALGRAASASRSALAKPALKLPQRPAAAARAGGGIKASLLSAFSANKASRSCSSGARPDMPGSSSGAPATRDSAIASAAPCRTGLSSEDLRFIRAAIGGAATAEDVDAVAAMAAARCTRTAKLPAPKK